MTLIRPLALALCFISLPAFGDAGPSDLPADDAGIVEDVGEYPDAGCPDGVCCVVLPNWDAAMFDAGPIDTGQRRRRPRIDAGQTPPPAEGGFGCSLGGAASLLWLLPLAASRRRKSQ